MQLKITTDAVNRKPTIILDGEDMTHRIMGVKLDMNPHEANVVEFKFMPHMIEFEGEAHVVANINGRKYKLIEEERIDQK